MKKLSKVLSLVLVIAMVFSLCVIGASASYADFTDKDKITDTYKEAVNVMTGVGIIDGMNATTFDAQGNFTRAQAAKIIAYMQLGPTAAAALKGTGTGYKDVAATAWYAPYVAYCTQMGIIGGYGNGNFGPNDALTGYQFAKMLLCAVGYGANKEYTGNSWSINVAKDALQKGVFTDVLSASTNSVITREQATQMAFNTLTGIDKVTYSTLVGDYITGGAIGSVSNRGTLGEKVYGITVYTGGTVSAVQAQGTKTATASYTAIDDVATAGNLVLYTNVDISAFGHAVKIYTNGKTTATTQKVYAVIDESVKSVTVTAKSTDTWETMAKAAGFGTNGTSYYATAPVSDKVAVSDNYKAAAAATIVAGQTYVLFSNDSDYSRVSAVIKVDKELEAVAFVKSATDLYGVTTNTYKLSSGTYYTYSNDTQDTISTSATLAAKDLVITQKVYNAAGSASVLYVEPAKTATATITSVSKQQGNNVAVVAGGTTYAASTVKNTAGVATTGFAALNVTKSDVVLILDAEGNLIGSTAAMVTANYGYVAKAVTVTSTLDPNFGSAGTSVESYKALIFFADGKSGIYTTVDAAGTALNSTEGEVYQVSMDAKGRAVLTTIPTAFPTIAAVDGVTYGVYTGVSKIGVKTSTNYYADANSVLFYVDGTYDATNANGTYGFTVKPVTGIANFKNGSNLAKAYYVSATNTLAVGTVNAAYALTSADVVYYNGDYARSFDGTNYTVTYTVYKNGTKDVATFISTSNTVYNAPVTTAGVYLVGANNIVASENGYTASNYFKTQTLAGKGAYGGNVLTVNGTDVIVSNTTPVVDVTAAGNTGVATLSDLNDIGTAAAGATYGSITVWVTYSVSATGVNTATAVYVSAVTAAA